MRWRLYIKPIFLVSYTVLLCIALPVLILELYKKSAPAIESAWFVSGLFVMGAVPISLWTILEHLVHYTKPYLQRHIIRILWMVPIYAVDAWLALRFPSITIYFDTLRECYEAYAIYNFLAFLLNYLKNEYPDLGFVIEQKPQVRHLIPFCLCKPWTMGRSFIDHCRHGTLQYTIVRPVMTAVALICELVGVYNEGNFSFSYAFLYLTIINNISQVWALYCLVLFYQCTKQELAPIKPVAKFLCVKFVVFMSFWQSILIAILAASGVIQKVEAWKLYDVRSISIGIQNFTICIEMFLAAIAHHFAFDCAAYRDSDAGTTHCCQSWWSMWDVSDMRRDVIEHIRHVSHSIFHLGSSSNYQSGRHYNLLIHSSSDLQTNLIDSSESDRLLTNCDSLTAIENHSNDSATSVLPITRTDQPIDVNTVHSEQFVPDHPNIA